MAKLIYSSETQSGGEPIEMVTPLTLDVAATERAQAIFDDIVSLQEQKLILLDDSGSLIAVKEFRATDNDAAMILARAVRALRDPSSLVDAIS